MYNFQAIISKGTNNALVQFERFGMLAHNLSNVDTNGYKRQSFEQILKEDGYLTGAIRNDYKQGSIRVTENPYDVAIDGPGYIPVTSPFFLISNFRQFAGILIPSPTSHPSLVIKYPSFPVLNAPSRVY